MKAAKFERASGVRARIKVSCTGSVKGGGGAKQRMGIRVPFSPDKRKQQFFGTRYPQDASRFDLKLKQCWN